ncbi:MAG: SH3 domain-containing protein [Sedimentitalea sp.]
MKRFIVVTFLGLGWVFYEMSGGADFEPRRLAPVQHAEAPAVTRTETVRTEPVEQVERVAVTELVVRPTAPERPAANPNRRAEIAQERIGQLGAAAGGGLSLFPEGGARGEGLTLASLEDGASGLVEVPTTTTVRPVDPVVTSIEARDIRVVNASRVNLRAGPGTDHSVVTKLTRDARVEVLSDGGDGWVQLRVVASGREGWIADYLLAGLN